MAKPPGDHPTGNGQLKRRHHTVPRFHLRRFANGRDQMTRVELPGDRRHLISVTDATVVKDFYLGELADGTWSDAVEDFLGAIEDDAAPAVRQIVDNCVWPIPDEARAAIANWAAVQYLRTPAMRRQQDDVADALAKLQIKVGGRPGIRRLLERGANEPVTDDDVEVQWQDWSNFDKFRVKAHPNEHLRLMMDLFPRVATMMSDRGWVLVRFQRKTLITSDNPVVLIAPEGHDCNYGVGLFTAAGIFVPLDRRVGLLMLGVNENDCRLPGTVMWSKAFNSNISFNARRAIFHHPDDTPLADMRLPQPREPEIDMRDQIEGLVLPDGGPR